LPGICFIGCGKIVEKHSKILKKLFPEIELSYASRDGIKAGEYKTRFNGRYSFSSYEEALNSDKYNIAFITTPHAFHSGLAVQAADKGKDIIIEKPVTRNTGELNKIIKAVQKNNVRCTVAENYYYKPAIKIIRSHINNGLIGSPLFIELNKTNRDAVTGWRTDPEMMGGGALIEGGVHWINAIVSIAGSDPVEVIAIRPEIKYDTDIPFEDSILLCIKFANGAVGKLLHSWRIPNPLKGVGISKVYGTDGIITFESNGLYVSLRGKKNKISVINPLDFLGFKAMHKELMESYLHGLEWQPLLSRIEMELKLIEAAYKSLKTNKFEPVNGA
ncbi:MAG: Gfo/Idh/MocA family oxidoreductase, partial [Spirochaetes bacterium]|nr:Gfo/Idh/MocA family oxidoreductase [Spirochaetota bacterium]